ncbi:MAG: hypothetical protein WCJ80_05710 [Bacteroidota bacterium]
MKKIIFFATVAILFVVVFSTQSCIRNVELPNVKYDTTITAVGNTMTCAGQKLTVTKGSFHITEIAKTPTNTSDSIVYTLTVQANELSLVDVNLKKYESNEKLVFQVKAGPKTNPIFSLNAKFHLESNDHTVYVISFKIHSDVSTINNSVIVDKGIFDPSNLGCLL